eukprot:TRINITY_DN672_c0_g1_i2.p1 TRINITY_DN672_c0_g1~~TRINITY_DN672_c0_g1_i2.p1  ORF type:complete len:110 (+),score=21.61 TRINITY_DN672_c0_g1_i2:79-408(+)
MFSIRRPGYRTTYLHPEKVLADARCLARQLASQPSEGSPKKEGCRDEAQPCLEPSESAKRMARMQPKSILRRAVNIVQDRTERKKAADGSRVLDNGPEAAGSGVSPVSS